MKFVYAHEADMERLMPATLKHLRQVDRQLQDDYGIGIRVDEINSRHDVIRIGYYNTTAENTDIASVIQQIKSDNKIDINLSEYIYTHCCVCGCQEDVKYDGFFYYCKRCREYNKSFYYGMLFDLRRYRNGQSQIINNIKTRLLTQDKKVIYKRFKELTIHDEKLCIPHLKNSHTEYEDVLYAGFDLGLRDITDERVYDGDVLLATMQNNCKFWGLVQKIESGWGNRFEGPNPQWGKYSLVHGFSTFPSSLAWAKSFRIIGSVYDIENFNGGDLTEDLYENWLYEHKSLVDQLTK